MNVLKRIEALEARTATSCRELATVFFSDGTKKRMPLDDVVPLLVEAPDRPSVVNVVAGDEPLLRLIQDLL